MDNILQIKGTDLKHNAESCDDECNAAYV